MSIRRDLLADANGDVTVTNGQAQWATDGVAIAQSLQLRFSFVLGEWFADQTAGVDYYGQIFVKNPRFANVRELLRTEALNTPGVNSIISLDTSFDSTTRTYSVACRVDTDFEELSISTSVGA